jgi:hypothetical protein
MDYRRGNPARLEDEPRHGLGKRARLSAGVLGRPDLAFVGSPCRHSITRCAP